MRRSVLSCAFSVIVFVFAACRSSDGNRGPAERGVAADTLVPTYAIERTERGTTDSEATATLSGDTIVVAGVIPAPNPCQDLRIETTRLGDDITFRVVARGQDVMCVQSIAAWGYRATLESPDEGMFTVRVVHVYENANWPADTVATVSFPVD